MQTLISGVEEAIVRTLVGEEGWQGAEASWIDSSELVQLLGSGTGRAGLNLAWLYRSPMDELLSAAEGGTPDAPQEVLDRWLSDNRAVLDFHRRDPGASVLLNVERVRRGGMPSGILGTVSRTRSASDRTPSECQADTVRAALQRVLELDFPWCIELFESLESSSWMPEGEVPWVRDVSAGAAAAELAHITEVLASVPVLSQRVEELDELVASRQRELACEREKTAGWMRENELLLLQLRKMQQEGGRITSDDKAEALSARIEELELQVKLLRKPVEQHLALLGAEEGAGPRVRLARMLLPPGSLALARGERCSRIQELRNSAWFDAKWYVTTYKDIELSRKDPVAHYYDWGWLEGRDPGPRFSTAYYLREYPDVAESGLNPLWHFVRYGEQEGRLPGPELK